MTFLIQYWRYILPIIVIIILSIGLWIFGNHKYNEGKMACQKEYEEKILAADHKAREEISKIRNGYDSTSKKVRAIPSSGSVGNSTAVAVQLLNESYIGQ